MKKTKGEHKIVDKDYKKSMSVGEKKRSFAIQKVLTTQGIGFKNSDLVKRPEHSKDTNTFYSFSTPMMLQSLQLGFQIND